MFSEGGIGAFRGICQLLPRLPTGGAVWPYYLSQAWSSYTLNPHWCTLNLKRLARLTSVPSLYFLFLTYMRQIHFLSRHPASRWPSLIRFKTHCKWIYLWMPSSPLTASPRVGKVIELLYRGGGGGGRGIQLCSHIDTQRTPAAAAVGTDHTVIATRREISRDSKDFR